MGFKRKIKRITEEIKATFKIAKVTSFSKAINTFKGKYEIQKMVKNGYHETPKAKKILLKKHDTMIEYFEKTFGEYLSNYNFNENIPDGNPEYSNNIWICWWQGIDKSPEIVKACVDSIKKNSGTHHVVILTEENYKNYITFPDWILKKVKEGIISKTNLSDLLRFSLLAKHGGMWLDSTFFAIGDLSKYFENDIWSIKRPGYLHCSVAGGMFAGYSLYCSYENRWMFNVMRDFFLHYWEINNLLIDYLLVDYMVVLAQKHDIRIKNAFDRIESNNPNCDNLEPVLFKIFDYEYWKKISCDTKLFKLTWKKNFSKVDLNSFYKKIIIKL